MWRTNPVSAFHSAICPSPFWTVYNGLFVDMWHKMWHKTHGKGSENQCYDSFQQVWCRILSGSPWFSGENRLNITTGCRCQNAACVTFELILCDKLCDSFAVTLPPPLAVYELICVPSACRGRTFIDAHAWHPALRSNALNFGSKLITSDSGVTQLDTERLRESF